MHESDQIMVDGITVDLVDPALCTPMPTSSDVLHRPDQVAQAACVLPPSGELLTAVQSLLPGRLSHAGLIDSPRSVRPATCLGGGEAGRTARRTRPPGPGG